MTIDFFLFLLIDAPDIVMDYREMKKSMFIESRPLYELSCAFEEKCLSSTASYYIHYPHAFSRTLIRFTSRFWNRGTSDFVTNVNKDNWEWHDCHAHYHSMERFADYDLVGKYLHTMHMNFKQSVFKFLLKFYLFEHPFIIAKISLLHNEFFENSEPPKSFL